MKFPEDFVWNKIICARCDNTGFEIRKNKKHEYLLYCAKCEGIVNNLKRDIKLVEKK